MSKISYIILHHAGGIASDNFYDTSKQKFEDIERYHQQVVAGEKKWISSLGLSTAYTYVIDYGGKVTQARLDTDLSWHTYARNNDLGICLIGNFSRFELPKMPSEAQITALKPLLKELMERHNIPIANVVGHRIFRDTECPGRNLSEEWIKGLFKKEEVKEELRKTQLTLLDKLNQLLTLLKRMLAEKRFGKVFEAK